MLFSEFGGFHLTLAEHELIQLREYSKIVEAQLENNLAKFNDWVAKSTAHLNEAEKHEFYGEMSREHTELSEIHPQILRQSLVITLASFIEKTLNSLCKDFQNHGNIALSYQDIQGKGLKRAQKYLKKVVRLDFPDTTQSWHQIMLIKEIRDYFVHSDGDVPKDLAERIQDSKQITALVRLSDKSIELDARFILHYIAQLEIFIYTLQAKVIEKSKASNP